MSTFGEYRPEVEVQADYEKAKRAVFAINHGLLGRITVGLLWIIRGNTLRRLRKHEGKQ